MRATNRSIIMAFVHGFVRSLLVVLYGGLCYAAASRPLVQIEESYPGSPLVTRVQEAESRREKHPQGKQFGGERKLAVDQIALDVLAPISEVDPEFLSVTIDAGDISRNWSGITFTAEQHGPRTGTCHAEGRRNQWRFHSLQFLYWHLIHYNSYIHTFFA